MSSTTPDKTTTTTFTPRRLVLFGCGGLVLVVAIALTAIVIQVNAQMQQPVNKEQVLLSLGGVPIYPGAQFDDIATNQSRALLLPFKGIEAIKNSTSVGFRTDDDAETKIIPFYDRAMQEFGFQKIKLDVRFGAKADASYVDGQTRIVVEVRPGEGEEAQMLWIARFDGSSKRLLQKPHNLVTPEDFKKLGIPIPPETPAKK